MPPALRAQLKALEDDQKRRATRSLRDGIDRILVDLPSLYRDVLLLQLGPRAEPINLAIYSQLVSAADATTAAATLATMDAIATAGKRIDRQRGAGPRPRGDADFGARAATTNAPARQHPTRGMH